MPHQDERDALSYEGPFHNGFTPRLEVHALPKRGHFDVAEIEKIALESAPSSTEVLDSGAVTIDGRESFFVASATKVLGERILTVKYLVPGRYDVFNISTMWREPAPREIQLTMRDVVQSVRVD